MAISRQFPFHIEFYYRRILTQSRQAAEITFCSTWTGFPRVKMSQHKSDSDSRRNWREKKAELNQWKSSGFLFFVEWTELLCWIKSCNYIRSSAAVSVIFRFLYLKCQKTRQNMFIFGHARKIKYTHLVSQWLENMTSLQL